jgi:nucleoside-diphosphate-sugar epimerase
LCFSAYGAELEDNGMSKVLVTGGAGFIGSHLSEALLEQGDEVFVIDDLSTGSMDNLSAFKTRIAFILWKDRFLTFLC